MALDHVPRDEARVTGHHALRNAVVEFEADEKPGERVFAGRCKAIFFEVLHPRKAAPAAVCLFHVNRRGFSDRLGGETEEEGNCER